jgi:hypothetical protein
VADVIHLIAELVENATKFSAPNTTVLLRAQPVAAGVAVEIEDRGLGMLPSDQQRLNDLLADPERVDVDELLRDGRIGLYVVAALARAQGIQVRLKNNIYGGTQATVLLPKSLLQQATADNAPTYPTGPTDEWRPRLTLVSPAAETVSGNVGVQPGLHAPGAQQVVVPPAPSQAMPAQPMPARQAPTQLPVAPGQRPPLPQRTAQASYDIPQPRDQQRSDDGDDSTARIAETPDHLTGLMADFLRGFGSAEEDDSPARD